MPRISYLEKITRLLVGACYFFMDKTNVIIAIINIIMYTYSIVITSLIRDDGITAQLGINMP